MSDKQLIFRALNEYFAQNKIPISEQVIDPQVYKVLDYAGNTYMQESLIEQRKKKRSEFIKRALDYAGNAHAQENFIEPRKQSVNSESVKLSAFMRKILTEGSWDEFGGNTIHGTAGQGSNSENPPATDNNQPSQNNNDAEWEKARKFVNDKNKYIFYFVLFDGRKVQEMTNLLNQKYSGLKGGLINMFHHMHDNFGNVNASVDGIMKDITKACKEQGIMGMFAYCNGAGGNRRAHIVANNIFEEENGKFLGEHIENYREFLTYGLEARFNNLENSDVYPTALATYVIKWNNEADKQKSTKQYIGYDTLYFEGNFNDNKWFGFRKLKPVIEGSNNNDKIKNWAERSLDIDTMPINIELAMYAYENNHKHINEVPQDVLKKSKEKMTDLWSKHHDPVPTPNIRQESGSTPAASESPINDPKVADDPSSIKKASGTVVKPPQVEAPVISEVAQQKTKLINDFNAVTTEYVKKVNQLEKDGIKNNEELSEKLRNFKDSANKLIVNFDNAKGSAEDESDENIPAMENILNQAKDLKSMLTEIEKLFEKSQKQPESSTEAAADDDGINLFDNKAEETDQDKINKGPADGYKKLLDENGKEVKNGEFNVWVKYSDNNPNTVIGYKIYDPNTNNWIRCMKDGSPGKRQIG